MQEVSSAKEEIKTQNAPIPSILEKTNEVEIIDFDESEIEIKKMESINKSIHDFIPIVEELEHPYIEPTPIVKIEELEPLNNQINKQIPIQEKDEITEQDNSFSKEQFYKNQAKKSLGKKQF
ncbi:hypothetical protein K4E85_04830 [Campylobacter coli]